jgi:hypothetical protein
MALAAPVLVASLTLIASATSCSSSTSSTSPQDAGTSDAPEVTVDTLADWSCLGKVKDATSSAATIPFSFGALDPFTAKGVTGAVVKTCARADVACASPFETLTTDDTGTVSFKSLPTGTTGFDGYFEVQVGSEIANLNFEGHPITAVIPKYGRTHYGDSQIATLLQTSATKVDLDRTRGVVTFQARDCSEYPAGVSCRESNCRAYTPGGVSFSLDVQDPKIIRGYISSIDGKVTLSTTATSTSALFGLGGFVNVPPGPVTLTAKVAATGQIIGTYKTFARAGAISAMVATPQ